MYKEYTRNVLTKFVQTIPADTSFDDIFVELQTMLINVPKLYSYLIKATYKDSIRQNWIIEYMVSQTDKYNTLNVDDSIEEILCHMRLQYDSTKSLIGYNQPPIDIIVEVYNPLISKLARNISETWPQIEFDDAYQLCMLTICKLRSKNYYIHKSLLQKATTNTALMSMRYDKKFQGIVHFDDVIHNGNNDAYTIADTLTDKQIEIDRERQENLEVTQLIFKDVKRVLLTFITERQFDELLRDYGNKSTTAWSRKKMQTIKLRLANLGITFETFKKRYQ